MYQDKIEYLKRAIKRTYKRYIGERTDEKATLTDVAKFFNIPIDESRLTDYQIIKIDFKEPSIEILDTQTDTTFTANYTSNADLLNCSGGKVRFISLISTNPQRKLESLSYIGDETQIITKITFSENEYDLIFEKEMPHSISFFSNSGEKFVVRYLKNMNYENQNVQQFLLTKIFSSRYSENSYVNFDDSFEQFFTYGLGQHYVERRDDQDKYAYIRNNNLIYGVNKLEKKDTCHYMYGICFESTKMNTKDYFPYNLRAEDYSILNDDKTNSAIIFKGGTGDAHHHSLEIYKTDETTHLKYYVKRNYYDECAHTETLVDQQFDLPILNVGNISSEELHSIIATLQEQFKEDDFIRLVSDELKTFGMKMDIRKGFVQEELNPLSPKLLLDKTFDEIQDLVIANKNDYFSLISEQFDSAVNIGSLAEKEQVKVLKSKNAQSNKN